MKLSVLALSALVLSTIGSTLHAQKSNLIIRGGINFANISNNDNGGYDDAKMNTNWQAGVIGDFNLTSFFAIQPGIPYTGKGIKWENGNEGSATYQNLSFNPKYIEVPVNFVFKTPTGAAKFFVGAGPYAAIGIGGKYKGEGLIDFTSDIQFSDDDPLTEDEEGAGAFTVKRFDYGLNGLIGLEAGSLVVTANYGLGLAKIPSNTDNNSSDNNKHRVLSLTLGFKF